MPALTILALALAQASAGAPITVRLRYERGPGAERCADEAAMRAQVERHLGRDPFDAGARRVVIARIERERDRLRGIIEVREEVAVLGVRRLSGAPRDCVELQRSLALALAISIDPLAMSRAPSSPTPAPAPAPAPVAPTPAPPAPAEPPAASVTATPPPPARAPDPGYGVELALGMDAAFGTLAEVEPALRGAARLRFTHASVGVEARVDLPAYASVGAGGEVAILWTAGSVFGCGHLRGFGACGLGTAGLLRSAGQNLEDGHTEVTPVAALGARVEWQTPLFGFFSLELHADGFVQLVTSRVRAGPFLVFETPRLSSAVGAALAARF